MAESFYSVVELVGSSEESWEKAAAVAINQASQTLRDLRVARVVEQDVHITPLASFDWTAVGGIG